jgi:hypothetical protein
MARAAALILLFTAAIDILVVDTAFASACDSNPTTSNSTQIPGSEAGDDDCYCRCTHMVLTTTPRFEVTETVESLSFDEFASPPSTTPKPIAHPPEA